MGAVTATEAASATSSWGEAPVAAEVGEGRVRFLHGPIDVILDAGGPRPAALSAYRRAWTRFQTLLSELAAELPQLRAPATADPRERGLTSPVAQRMAAAVAPHAAETFVTPMAAVAGSVADALLETMWATPGLTRIAVNNGGDIALWLAPGERYRIALADPRGEALGVLALDAAALGSDGRAGVATSGWRGRSHSLGIADSVTALADTAAAADVAATLIANAVDLPNHPAITRAPAASLAPDSDLGARLVVVDVQSAGLSSADRRHALAAGLAAAETLAAEGRITAATLHLGGDAVQTTTAPRIDPAPQKSEGGDNGRA